MRISDWSSDVCSSDLRLQLTGEDVRLRIAGRALRVLEVVLGISDANQMRRIERIAAEARIDGSIDHILSRCGSGDRRTRQPQKCSPRVGRASCRERVYQHV